MSNKKYSQGKNPNSHHNRPKVDRKRVVIPVSCSKAQKKAVDNALRHIKPRFKSKYIVDRLRDAIAVNNTDLAEPAPNEAEWQISVRPEVREEIYQWCDLNLPDKCRSRWIIQIVSSR